MVDLNGVKDVERKFFMWGFILLEALEKISEPWRTPHISELINIAISAQVEFEGCVRGTPDVIYSTDPKSPHFALKRKKVYCDDCEFLHNEIIKIDEDTIQTKRICTHNKNWYTEAKEDEIGFLYPPSVFNRSNYCDYFALKLDGRN